MIKKETYLPVIFCIFFFLNFSPPPPCTHTHIPHLIPLQMAGPDHPAFLTLFLSSLSKHRWFPGTQSVSTHPFILKSWVHCSISALSAGSLLALLARFSPPFSLSSQLAFSSPHELMKLAPSSVYWSLLGLFSEIGVPQVCLRLHPSPHAECSSQEALLCAKNQTQALSILNTLEKFPVVFTKIHTYMYIHRRGNVKLPYHAPHH